MKERKKKRAAGIDNQPTFIPSYKYMMFFDKYIKRESNKRSV